MGSYWKRGKQLDELGGKKKTDMDLQLSLREASAQPSTHGGIWAVLVGATALPVVVGVWAWTPAARRAARTTKLALNNMA